MRHRSAMSETESNHSRAPSAAPAVRRCIACEAHAGCDRLAGDAGLTDLIDEEHTDITPIGSYLDGLDPDARWREVKQLDRDAAARAVRRRPPTPSESTSRTSSVTPAPSGGHSRWRQHPSGPQGLESGSRSGSAGRRETPAAATATPMLACSATTRARAATSSVRGSSSHGRPRSALSGRRAAAWSSTISRSRRRGRRRLAPRRAQRLAPPALRLSPDPRLHAPGIAPRLDRAAFKRERPLDHYFVLCRKASPE